MKILLAAAALSTASLTAQGAIAPRAETPIDFSSDAGFHATCARFTAPPDRSANDRERTAYAICESVAIASDVHAWLHAGGPDGTFDTPEGLARARARVESYLPRVAAVRAALEPVKARSPLFEVRPGTWAVDLDRDGNVSVEERYFFWVPRRGSDVSPFARAASEAEYLARYEAPVVNVDQSDIHWALAYCNFAEAALHLVLAYDFDATRRSIVLADRDRVRTKAYPRLREGIRQSMRLREALLAETDDDREWIASPRQRQTSFPLVMDGGTFATWGEALTQASSLLEGRTLLGGKVAGGRGALGDLTFGLCPSGQGIDVRELFTNPLVHAFDPAELAARCVAATPAKPMTALAALVARSIERNATSQGTTGEWQVLRHLYWVN